MSCCFNIGGNKCPVRRTPGVTMIKLSKTGTGQSARCRHIDGVRYKPQDVRRDTLEVLCALGVVVAESKLESDMRVCSDHFKEDIYINSAMVLPS